MNDINLTSKTDMFGTLSKAEVIKEYYNNLDLGEKHVDKMTALYGSWGSGKSTIMKYVYDNLDINKYNPIWFDSWLYEKDDNLALSLLHKIHQESSKSLKGKALEISTKAFKSLLSVFQAYASGFSSEIGIPGLVKIGYSVEKSLKKIEELEEKTIQKSFHLDILKVNDDFNKILPTNKYTIIFLDDLDRCEHDNILNLLSAVFNIFSKINSVLILAGVDNKAIVKALSYRYGQDSEKAEHYLEKVFTRDYYVSHPYGVAEVVKSEFDGFHDDFIRFFNKCQITNPRTILKTLKKYKRFIKDTDSNHNLEELFSEVTQETLVYHYIVLFMIYLIQNHNDEYKEFLYGYNESISYSKYFEIKISRDNIQPISSTDGFEIPYLSKVSNMLNYTIKNITSSNALFGNVITKKDYKFIGSHSPISDKYNETAFALNCFILSLRFCPSKKITHRVSQTGLSRNAIEKEFFKLFDEEISSNILSNAKTFRVLFGQFLYEKLDQYYPPKTKNGDFIKVVKSTNFTFRNLIESINNYL